MTPSLLDLSGRVAVVTGGGNGIGRACCRLLAAHGADVVVADLDRDAAEAVASDVRADGRRALAVRCDVTDDGDRQRLVDRAVADLGGVHVLVNNAAGGGAGRESPSEITVERFASVFALNVFSGWRLAQLCAPHMERAGGGSVVTVSSMASVNASPAISAYAASKAAVNHMTANLAHDYGPTVRVNAVAPGAIRTDALASVLTPEIEHRMHARTPLDRLGEPEDVASAVLYLVSPMASWVSGQTLFVNGGGVQTLD